MSEFETVIPEEHPVAKGFYYYPENRNLLVSKDIRFKDVRKLDEYRKPYLNKETGYASLYFEYNSIRVNRIMARTFIGRPLRHLDKPYSELVVNHIDFVRTNNNIDNLEWCTEVENSRHSRFAFRHPKDSKCWVKNVYTGEEKLYSSVSHVAELFRVHRATLWKMIVTKRNFKTQINGHIVKLDDGSPWPSSIDPSKLRNLGFVEEKNIEVLVTDKTTQTHVSLPSIYDVYKYTGISPRLLINRLTSKTIYEDVTHIYKRLTPLAFYHPYKDEVIKLLGEGKNISEISRLLNMDRATVRKVKNNLDRQ